MKKQGYNDKLDESMSARSGKKKQTMPIRRKESEGMEKSMGKKKYSSVKTMNENADKKGHMSARTGKLNDDLESRRAASEKIRKNDPKKSGKKSGKKK